VTVKIKPEDNVITDDLLDTLGREWAFDHVKGQNELWKNAADQYIRDEIPDEDQVILVELLELKPKKNSVFRVIDFGGMAHNDIVNAFKRWGDISAASRNSGKRTFGGHGNGGKFYMRSAFETSRFVTYRAGRLNVYGFNRSTSMDFRRVTLTSRSIWLLRSRWPRSMPPRFHRRPSHGLRSRKGSRWSSVSGRTTSSGAPPPSASSRSSHSIPRLVGSSLIGLYMPAPSVRLTGSCSEPTIRSPAPTSPSRS